MLSKVSNMRSYILAADNKLTLTTTKVLTKSFVLNDSPHFAVFLAAGIIKAT